MTLSVHKAMPNNPIPSEKRERIEQLSKQDYAIRRIAKMTETCRPTVRKYQNLMETNSNT